MERNIKRSSFIISIFITLIFYNCGRNITYIEETDLTGKVQLNNIECDSVDLDLKLKKISILDTEQDTVIYRSHNELNIKIYLIAVNRSNKPITFLINRSKYNPENFRWTLKKDTVFFYNFEEENKFIIKPNDSLSFSMKAYSFNFEKLLGKQRNYTEDMLKLLFDFKLVYDNEEKEICVNQDSNTAIGVYNDKSKWSWW